MERETKTVKCPSGKEAVLKAYLTAGERRQLRNTFAEAIRLPMTRGEDVRVENLGEAMNHGEDVLIRMAVTSYDGNADQIVERLLDGNPKDGTDGDYEFIVEEAGKLNSVFTQAK
ncbi:MAG: hypothetical protein WCV84_04680 [Patescibacteria group bacterium]